METVSDTLRNKIGALVQRYEEVKPKIRKSPHYPSEQDTMTKFIRPMLEAFGWDFLDPEEVREELPFEEGHIDCVLYLNGNPHIVIECKHLGLSALTSKNDYRKRRERAKRFGVNIFVYTNFAETIIHRFKEREMHYFEKPSKYLRELNTLKQCLLKNAFQLRK